MKPFDKQPSFAESFITSTIAPSKFLSLFLLFLIISSFSSFSSFSQVNSPDFSCVGDQCVNDESNCPKPSSSPTEEEEEVSHSNHTHSHDHAHNDHEGNDHHQTLENEI